MNFRDWANNDPLLVIVSLFLMAQMRWCHSLFTKYRFMYSVFSHTVCMRTSNAIMFLKTNEVEWSSNLQTNGKNSTNLDSELPFYLRFEAVTSEVYKMVYNCWKKHSTTVLERFRNPKAKYEVTVLKVCICTFIGYMLKISLRRP